MVQSANLSAHQLMYRLPVSYFTFEEDPLFTDEKIRIQLLYVVNVRYRLRHKI